MKKFLCGLAAIAVLAGIMPSSMAYNTEKHPIIHETGKSLKGTEHKEKSRIEERYKKHERTKGEKQIQKGKKLEQKGRYDMEHGNTKKGQKEYKKGQKMIQKGEGERQKGESK